MVHLIIAPAGHGKTRHCITRIKEVRAKAPLASIWVILPNQAQVAAFRRRLAEEGGALGVQLGTFYTFYAEIMARTGRPIPRLLDPVQHRLLRTIVDRLCEEGRLRHYAPLRDKPGFVRLLRALFRELKRARVRRDDLIAAVADVYDALTTARPYRPALAPHRALEIMAEEYVGRLEPRLLERFIEMLGPYPWGTVLRVSDDLLVVVTRPDQTIPDNPYSRAIHLSAGPPTVGEEVPLRELTSVSQLETVDPAEIGIDLPGLLHDLSAPQTTDVA